jgi:hypothetical protein
MPIYISILQLYIDMSDQHFIVLLINLSWAFKKIQNKYIDWYLFSYAWMRNAAKSGSISSFIGEFRKLLWKNCKSIENNYADKIE